MQLFQLLAAALSGGTVLLFGMLGGIFTETSGVMNLAIEGYMLLGATISYSVSASTGNPWIGLLMGAVSAAILGIFCAFNITSRSERPLRHGHLRRRRRRLGIQPEQDDERMGPARGVHRKRRRRHV